MNILKESEFASLSAGFKKVESVRFAKCMEYIMQYRGPVTEYLIRLKVEDAKSGGPTPRCDKIITWGKHKGSKIVDLPESYVKWVISKSGLEPETKEWFRKIYYDK